MSTDAIVAAASALAAAAHENPDAWSGEAHVPWHLVYALRDALREAGHDWAKDLT